MDANEVRRAAGQARKNAAALADGEVKAKSKARYLAAQVSLLAQAVEELADKLEASFDQKDSHTNRIGAG